MTETHNNSNYREWWIVFGISLAGILIAIDFNIVNICLPTIQGYFNVNTNTLQWLMLGFGITFSSFMTALGKLADIIGRRKILYASIIMFILGSLGAGMSTNIGFLISMRILQGISGASLFPCGLAIIAASFPKSKQVKVIGIYGSTLGVGLALGPLLGGIIVSILDWRWIFLINVPLGIISLIICIFIGKLKESKHSKVQKIDWIGTFCLIILVGGFCFTISQGNNIGWTSPLVLTFFIILPISVLGLYKRIKTFKYPIISIKILTNKAFLLSATVYIVTISTTWIIAFYVPLYLHLVKKYNMIRVSSWFSIITIMTIIAPPICSYLFSRYSKFMITHVAFISSILGLGLLTLFSSNTSILMTISAFTLVGFAWGAGNGIGMPIGLLSIKGSSDAGMVSGALLTILNIFGTIFVSIATKIFTSMQHLKSSTQNGELLLVQNNDMFLRGFSAIFLVFVIFVIITYITNFKVIKSVYKQS